MYPFDPGLFDDLAIVVFDGSEEMPVFDLRFEQQY